MTQPIDPLPTSPIKREGNAKSAKDAKKAGREKLNLGATHHITHTAFVPLTPGTIVALDERTGGDMHAVYKTQPFLDTIFRSQPAQIQRQKLVPGVAQRGVPRVAPYAAKIG